MENNQFQIKTKDQDLKGFYSNSMQIVHNHNEFILDFLLFTSQQGILGSRIIMSPGYTKRIIKTLKENLAIYEKKFGKIETFEKTKTIKNKKKMGFNNK